jgi:hypothetical protein
MTNKLFPYLLVFLLFFSCNQKSSSEGISANGSMSIPDGPAHSLDEALPPEAFSFETNITFLNTTPSEQDKFDRALEIIKKVVATDEFRNQILSYNYNGTGRFHDNAGFTNSQVYQKILNGDERLYPQMNNTIDMQVELYFADTTTIGYTYPSSTQIWVNRKYFSKNSVYSVAANLFHEWLHKLGFTHAVSYSVSRDHSVPYAVGRMISRIGAARGF